MSDQSETKIYEITLSNGEIQYFRGTGIYDGTNAIKVYDGEREVGSVRNPLAWKEHADDGSFNV